MGRAARRLAWEAVGRPALRMLLVTIFCISWFIGSAYAFLDFLPANFAYYNRLIVAQGTNNNDVWFFWGWIPTLFIFIIGLFWATGVLGRFWRILLEI